MQTRPMPPAQLLKMLDSSIKRADEMKQQLELQVGEVLPLEAILPQVLNPC